MKPTTVNAYILQKLGFPHPMDYDVKPDGTLAVIDYNGQKFVIPFKDYSMLLNETAESRRGRPALDHAQRTGAEPKSVPAKKKKKPESRQPQVALDHALREDDEANKQN